MSSRYKTYLVVKLSFKGDGLAMESDGSRNVDIVNSRLVHIANVLPLEIVTAVEPEVDLPDDRVHKREACLIDVIEPSGSRCDPVCTHWRRCPACQYQCMKYDTSQEVHKRDKWLALIDKYTDIDRQGCLIGYRRAYKTLAYRHRTDAIWTHGLIGILPRHDFLRLESEAELLANPTLEKIHYRPIPMRECRLHAPELNALIERTEAILRENGLPEETRIEFESNHEIASDNDRIILYAKPDESDQIRILCRNLYEKLHIPVILQVLPPHGSHVYPKPESFGDDPWYGYDKDGNGDVLYALKGAWTPVNPPNAHMIRDALKQLIGENQYESVLELGCGCGTHTSVFKGHTQNYTGIDASWPAIQSAQYNAEVHGWEHVSFYTDTAEHYLEKRYYGGRRADLILMHSNRLPYSSEVAQMCKRFGAKDMLIVAPTAYALSQECAHFEKLGFVIKQLILCDTMPMTYHMMGVAHLKLA